MRTMTADESREFLSRGTSTGKLAVVRADGSPHVSPIWFVADGTDLVFTTWHESVKARAMLRDPRVSLVVDEEVPPYAFVQVQGTVRLSADPGNLLRFATAIGARYMGADRAAEFGRRNGVEGELLVRLTPTKIIARADLAD